MRRLIVVGAGAVGSLFGARLSRTGASVLLIGRPAHVAAVRAEGLRVEGVEPGTSRLDAATEVPAGTVAEAALMTVKSFDLAPASEALARAVRPVPTALLGNGLGIEEVAGRGLRAGGWPRPEEMIVRAVHTVPATFLGPGVVRASGTGEVVLPDPGTAGGAAAAVRTFAQLFSEAGLAVRTSRTFELELWRKAAVNAAINPVTATRRVPNGELAAGTARREAERLLAEAVAVARASGLDLSEEVARADLDRVVRATAENRSSMLQDVERGRPTEIDAISGEILRRGRALGLDLPATAEAIDRVRRAAERPDRPAQR